MDQTWVRLNVSYSVDRSGALGVDVAGFYMKGRFSDVQWCVHGVVVARCLGPPQQHMSPAGQLPCSHIIHLDSYFSGYRSGPSLL